MAFFAGIGYSKNSGGLLRRLTPTQSATSALPARAPASDSGMFDPDGKVWERPTPGSGHPRRAPAFERGSEPDWFPILERQKGLDDAFAGLLRALVLEDKRH
jgi:hypothetical protein